MKVFGLDPKQGQILKDDLFFIDDKETLKDIIDSVEDDYPNRQQDERPLGATGFAVEIATDLIQ